MTPKRVLLLIAILFAQFSQAEDIKSADWPTLVELRKQRKVYFDMPEFNLTHGVFLKADKVCLGGEKADIIEPIGFKNVRKCVRGAEGLCTKEITVTPTRKVNGHRYQCMVWKDNDESKGCAMWGNMPFKIDTEFEIEIFSLEGTVRIPVMKKSFKVPHCKEVE